MISLHCWVFPDTIFEWERYIIMNFTRWPEWRQSREASRCSDISTMFDRYLSVNLVPHLLQHHQHLQGRVGVGAVAVHRHLVHVGSSLDPMFRGLAGANTSMIRTSPNTPLYRPVLVSDYHDATIYKSCQRSQLPYPSFNSKGALPWTWTSSFRRSYCRSYRRGNTSSRSPNYVYGETWTFNINVIKIESLWIV